MEVVVTGFYCSGTSRLAHLLSVAGLSMREELGASVEPDRDDEFSGSVVTAIHDGILNDNGTDLTLERIRPLYISKERWDEMSRFIAQRQARDAIWGFADPRTCLFLGAWKFLLPDSRAVIVYRDPAECVGRIEKSMVPSDILEMWCVYNQHAVAFARANVDDCLVVPFERVDSVISAINTRFGADLPVALPAPAPQMAESSQFRHSPEPGPHRNARVTEIWRSLEELAEQTAVGR